MLTLQIPHYRAPVSRPIFMVSMGILIGCTLALTLYTLTWTHWGDVFTEMAGGVLTPLVLCCGLFMAALGAVVTEPQD